MRRLVILLAAVCVLIPACGRGQNPSVSEDAPGGAAETALTVVARNTAFDPTKLKAPAGEELTITFRNEDAGVNHSFHLFGGSAGDAKTDIKPGPSTDTVKITLAAAATYAFQCDVHPKGMAGQLFVVEAESEN
jgi:plastocyanin